MAVDISSVATVDTEPGQLPAKMAAWVIRQEREGEPKDAMQLEEVDVPEPGAFEVVVRVMAAGVNFNNVWASLGKPIPVQCPRCKTRHWAQLTGNSPGVSDVILTHKTRWPGVWKMLETKKGPKAKRRKEQIELANAGLSTFYVTEEQAVRTVIDIEQRMGLEVNPRLLSWLREHVPGNRDKTVEALLANDTPNATWRP